MLFFLNYVATSCLTVSPAPVKNKPHKDDVLVASYWACRIPANCTKNESGLDNTLRITGRNDRAKKVDAGRKRVQMIRMVNDIWTSNI